MEGGSTLLVAEVIQVLSGKLLYWQRLKLLTGSVDRPLVLNVSQ